MGEVGKGDTKGPEDGNLTGSIVDMVVPANDVGDSHIGIVDHHGKVVGRHAVGAKNDEIIKGRTVEGEGSPDQIFENDGLIVGSAEA